jgi:hypothetical protein
VPILFTKEVLYGIVSNVVNLFIWAALKDGLKD